MVHGQSDESKDFVSCGFKCEVTISIPGLFFFLSKKIYNIKNIWNRVDCQHSEKRSKAHKRWKEHFLIRQNRTRRVYFWGSSLFQATCNNKTEEKKHKNSAYQLVSLVPFSFHQLPTSNWYKISWVNRLFFCCCCFFVVVLSLRKRTS